MSKKIMQNVFVLLIVAVIVAVIVAIKNKATGTSDNSLASALSDLANDSEQQQNLQNSTAPTNENLNPSNRSIDTQPEGNSSVSSQPVENVVIATSTNPITSQSNNSSALKAAGLRSVLSAKIAP